MNCANHPDLPVAAFCQFCGKPLCTNCVRSIGNIVGCEPCMTARLGAAPASNYSVHMGGQGFQYTASGPFPPPHHPGVPNPSLAFVLGLIPGVGAMYNGQFAKGLLHVLVFVMLVDLSRWNGLLGICIAAWIFYQVFDAYHTAIARRDGLPLPNPLGINDIGLWFTGLHPGPRQNPPTNGVPVNPAASPESPFPQAGVPGAPAASPYAASFSAAPGFTPGMPPVPPDQCDLPDFHPGIPTGAVILMGLGILFLLGNFGILHGHWLDHFWPLFLIGLGAWILIRRSQWPPPGSRPPGGNSMGGPQ